MRGSCPKRWKWQAESHQNEKDRPCVHSHGLSTEVDVQVTERYKVSCSGECGVISSHTQVKNSMKIFITLFLVHRVSWVFSKDRHRDRVLAASIHG